MTFDLIIIGGSAASASAGIYAARRNLNFKIITMDFGGEVATSGEIGNYPGIVNTNGIELSEKFKKHLEHYKVGVETGIRVEKITKQDDGSFCIKTKKVKPVSTAGEKMEQKDNDAMECDYTAQTVILATGVHPRSLNIPGDKEYRNKGVSYCTTCDGPLFKDKVTITIGGGNSALESGLMMATIAKKHYIVNIHNYFKGDKILYKKLKEHKNVEIIFNAQTTEIFGDGNFVKGIKYLDKEKNEIKELRADGIFIHIGVIPNSDIAPDGVEKNNFGEIKVNKKGETNIPGFFAAGDVTDIPYKQIVIAAGQGAAAALAAVEYLNRREDN